VWAEGGTDEEYRLRLSLELIEEAELMLALTLTLTLTFEFEVVLNETWSKFWFDKGSFLLWLSAVESRWAVSDSMLNALAQVDFSKNFLNF